MQRKDIEDAVKYICEHGSLEQQLTTINWLLSSWEQMCEGRQETPSDPVLFAHHIAIAAQAKWSQQVQEIREMIRSIRGTT